MPHLTILNDNSTREVPFDYALYGLAKDEVYGWYFSCRGGVCGSCMVSVVEGAENLSPAEEVERQFLASVDAAPDQRLACLCKVRGDISLRF